MIFHSRLRFHPQMPHLLSRSFADGFYKHVDIYLPVSRLAIILYCVSVLRALSISFIYNMFNSCLTFMISPHFHTFLFHGLLFAGLRKNVQECVLFIYLFIFLLL